MTEQLKKVELHSVHKEFGAKIVTYAGFEMPLSFSGMTIEHLAVRKSVGLFDVSHMGEFKFYGEGAFRTLQHITINDVSRLEIYQAQYSAMCDDSGGIIDDILLYRFPEHYLMVVNAANTKKDFNWINNHKQPETEFLDISDSLSLLAVQGPRSIETLQKIVDINLSAISYYRFAEGKAAGVSIMISYTGYTGELGFELCFPREYSETLWYAIMEAGKEFEIKPVGLGARDSLRLEKAYRLYGNDITRDTNPFEAGLGWITKLKKGDFIGSDSLKRIQSQPVDRKLAGFVIHEKGIPRSGYNLFKDERLIGKVTSGIFSPLMQKGIGMGYVKREFAGTGTIIQVGIRNKYVSAEIISVPFI